MMFWLYLLELLENAIGNRLFLKQKSSACFIHYHVRGNVPYNLILHSITRSYLDKTEWAKNGSF